MCVRTDENPEVFVLCGFCRPGANARGETRKNSKKWLNATFSTVSAAPNGRLFRCTFSDAFHAVEPERQPADEPPAVAAHRCGIAAETQRRVGVLHVVEVLQLYGEIIGVLPYGAQSVLHFADFSLVRRQPRPEFCHLGGMDLFRRQTHAGAYEAHKGRGVVPERLYAAVLQLRKLLAIVLYALRRVEDITAALWGSKVSPGTISNLNKKVYGHIEEWRQCKLQYEYPYVYLHGIYLKRNWGGEYENVAILVAMAVNEEGYRTVK